MESIHIVTKDKDYKVQIGSNCINHLPDSIQSALPNCNQLFVFVDSNLYPIYWDQLHAQLTTKFHVSFFVVPAGETSKSFSTYETCITKVLEQKMKRTDAIVAFGGGMVGDLSGLVAATYMRGIPFIQIPTTLLAHDSSVGGKVAINHALGKNIIGAFYQPSLVFYDLQFLNTLSDREWRSGYAELLKHALLSGKDFVRDLMEEIKDIDALKESGNLSSYIKRGIETKKSIVEKDEKELDIRGFLNLGHTFAHALETFYHYKGLSHGEAVAIGLLFALDLSEELGCKDFTTEILYPHLINLGYTYNKDNLDAQVLTDFMVHDKKNKDQSIRFVLLKSIGNPYFKSISKEELVGRVNAFLNKYSF